MLSRSVLQRTPATETPRFLLIVRERLRPGSEAAYDKNECELATVCATFKCPHPYLALATVAGPKEVWWLNAFALREERDGLDASYAKDELLMAAMLPLGKRKEDFRETFTSTMTEYRRDLSGGAGLRIAGARFLVIKTARDERAPTGAVFQAADGTRFVIAAATTGLRPPQASATTCGASKRSSGCSTQPTKKRRS